METLERREEERTLGQENRHFSGHVLIFGILEHYRDSRDDRESSFLDVNHIFVMEYLQKFGAKYVRKF